MTRLSILAALLFSSVSISAQTPHAALPPQTTSPSEGSAGTGCGEEGIREEEIAVDISGRPRRKTGVGMFRWIMNLITPCEYCYGSKLVAVFTDHHGVKHHVRCDECW